MNMTRAFNAVYYGLKPILPRRLQIWVRGKVVKAKRRRFSGCWPILEAAGRRPDGWPDWPRQKRMAVVLTHDVESRRGLVRCMQLARMEMELGFRSSFNFVAKKYAVPDSLLDELVQNGFEIGVHGVYHDGKLFQSRRIFRERARIINRFLLRWQAVGFRSPAMHHNLEWLHELDIDYDLSTFDTDPFEPQSDGVSTIFPFWVDNSDHSGGYLEMPYTLVQDFTLFVLMRERTTHVWEEKLRWIYHRGGMALLNTHPDYMAFEGEKPAVDQYPVERYLDFLRHLQAEYRGRYWHALPKEVVAFSKDADRYYVQWENTETNAKSLEFDVRER